MSRSIDSLSNRPEEKSSRPIAGDVVRPHSKSNPQAGEIVQPRGAKAVPKAAPVESRTLAAELDAEKAINHLRRGNYVRNNRQTLKIVAIVIATLGVLIAGIIFFNRSRQINGVTRTVVNSETRKQAEESFNALESVKSLPTDRQKEYFNTVKDVYTAAYVSGMAPTDQELRLAAMGGIGTKDTFQRNIEKIINRKLTLAANGGFYSGEVYYFWFGRTIANKLPEETIESYGDPAVLQADKEYALTKANDYREKLIKASSTSQDLIAALEADPRLQLYDEANGSAVISNFNQQSAEPNDDGRAASVKAVVDAMQTPGISAVSMITADPGEPKSGVKKEVGYVVVKLSQLIRGQAAVDFYNQQLTRARSGI